jgi:hypothetical protein
VQFFSGGGIDEDTHCFWMGDKLERIEHANTGSFKVSRQWLNKSVVLNRKISPMQKITQNITSNNERLYVY